MNPDLKEKKIVITRPIERSIDLSDIIIENNGVPIIVPTLELQSVETEELSKLRNTIDTYDWLIFTSPAGVQSFFKNKEELPKINFPKIIVIGIKTKEELEKYGYIADIIPSKYTAEGILETISNLNLENKKIAIPRTLSARNTLPDGLKAKKANVNIVEAYKSGVPKSLDKIYELIEFIKKDEIDVITFTSPLTVTNLMNIIKKDSDFNKIIEKLRNNIIIVSIGPITTKTLTEYSITTIEPEVYTVKNMIDSLIKYLNNE
ncbi:MAG: uroporphyrinogen-III synthase [Methanobacteriaceae archaeon]|nr:uroporphyrinogen-III synthase [Methanobacteriaceae archaeon]